MRHLLVLSAAALTLAACGQSRSTTTTTASTQTTASTTTASPAPGTPNAAPLAPATPSGGATVSASDAPHQRAGLWRVVTEAGGQTENSTHCVTPQESQRGLDPAQVGGEGCSESSLTRDGNAYVIRATCGGATTSMRVTGDMQSTMRVETEMSAPGQPAQRMVMTGTYSGQPCSGEE